MGNTVTFSTVLNFANFCAQLTREGIAFHGDESPAAADDARSRGRS